MFGIFLFDIPICFLSVENIYVILQICLSFVICRTEAFAVCENYSPPEGFKEQDLYHLLEKVGTPSGGDDLGKGYKCLYNALLPPTAPSTW